MTPMTLVWVREDAPVWDAEKQRVIGGAPEGAFDLSFAEGDPLAGEWWSVRDGEGGPVVAYGRLAIGRGGDAEILLAVDPARQEEGIGTFVLGALEGEALRRGVNYVYNVIPEHRERVVVHDCVRDPGLPRPDRRPAAQAHRGPARSRSGAGRAGPPLLSGELEGCPAQCGS